MFGLGWSEMMVVGIVALIVIGPKDLPVVFRTMGEFTGKAKAMAREFSRAMNDAAKDSGVNDISAGLKAAANPKAFGKRPPRAMTVRRQKPPKVQHPVKPLPRKALQQKMLIRKTPHEH